MLHANALRFINWLLATIGPEDSEICNRSSLPLRFFGSGVEGKVFYSVEFSTHDRRIFANASAISAAR
jgi:hypothetical protein